MRVLVIGASGFIGQNLVRHLIANGHDVTFTGRRADVGGCLALDVREPSQVSSVVGSRQFDCVVNASGIGVTPGSASVQEMDEVNVVGARNVACSLSTLANPPLLVQLGSAAAPRGSEPPESAYARSKAAGTLLVADVAARTGVPSVFARIHNVYGAGQPSRRFVRDLVDSASRRAPFRVEYPDRIRDFCHIDDVAKALGAVIERHAYTPWVAGSEVEVGTATGTRLWDAANLVFDVCGAPGDLLSRPEAARPDPHPCEVADAGGSGFVACKTQFSEGIERVVRGMS